MWCIPRKLFELSLVFLKLHFPLFKLKKLCLLLIFQGLWKVFFHFYLNCVQVKAHYCISVQVHETDSHQWPPASTNMNSIHNTFWASLHERCFKIRFILLFHSTAASGSTLPSKVGGLSWRNRSTIELTLLVLAFWGPVCDYCLPKYCTALHKSLISNDRNLVLLLSRHSVTVALFCCCLDILLTQIKF